MILHVHASRLDSTGHRHPLCMRSVLILQLIIWILLLAACFYSYSVSLSNLCPRLGDTYNTNSLTATCLLLAKLPIALR